MNHTANSNQFKLAVPQLPPQSQQNQSMGGGEYSTQ